MSLWHWIVLVVPLALLALVIIAIGKRINIGRRHGAPGTEARLRELDSLKSKGAITDAEYESRRSAVLRDI